MKKKKGPVSEMFESIWAQLDQIEEHAMKRSNYIALLKAVRWNLEYAAKSGVSNANVWQALGLVKGALSGLGGRPDET